MPEDDYWPDTEERNLYAQSQMDRPPDDSAHVNELLSLGRYVVVCDATLTCRHTDAILPGRHRTLISDHEHYDDAVMAAKSHESHDEADYHVLSPERPKQPIPPINDEDIPF